MDVFAEQPGAGGRLTLRGVTLHFIRTELLRRDKRPRINEASAADHVGCQFKTPGAPASRSSGVRSRKGLVMKSTQASMRARWARGCCVLAMSLLSLLVAGKVRAEEFTYTNIDGTITITGYTGSGGN